MSSTDTSWAGLAPSIRHQILRFLLYDEGLAGFATVSREWQAVIEQHNFARIDLTPSRLSQSKPILIRKRKLIHYIWYRLELQPYDCSVCTPEEDNCAMSDPDSSFVSEAFLSLCSALSQWEPNGDLVLDVSVYSPSDPEHWFKYLDFRPDLPFGESPSRLRYDESSSWTPPHDPSHGWVDGRQATAPGYESIDKAFNEIMSEGPFEDEEQEMEWWQQLPSVPAITGILFRQQNRRRWKPRALSNMLTRFPNLKEICYEPWREWEHMSGLTDGRKSLCSHYICGHYY